MAQSEIDSLRTYLEDKFEDFAGKHRILKKDLDKLRIKIPQIAREEAESTIAKTALITPGTKWAAAGVCLTTLVLLFSIYGKQTAALTLFQEMRNDMKDNKVIEQVHWVKANKTKISSNFKKQEERIQKLEQKIEVLRAKYTNPNKYN